MITYAEVHCCFDQIDHGRAVYGKGDFWATSEVIATIARCRSDYQGSLAHQRKLAPLPVPLLLS
jgi:hypothetical protein